MSFFTNWNGSIPETMKMKPKLQTFSGQLLTRNLWKTNSVGTWVARSFVSAAIWWTRPPAPQQVLTMQENAEFPIIYAKLSTECYWNCAFSN